jgi:hypothetical protein
VAYKFGTGSEGHRWRRALALVTVVGSGVALLATASASAAFCDTTVVRNYAAPLEKLPAIRTLKTSPAGLPFGPPGLRLVKTAFVQLTKPVYVPGEGPRPRPVGFRLVNETTERPGRAELNWTVSAQLTVLSDGSTVLGKKIKRVSVLPKGGKRSLTFAMPEDPGNYLVQIEFHDAAGKRLGRYGSYFRVVKPTQDTHITLSAASVRPGEALSACVENFGTSAITYGLGFTIESLSGSTWSRSSISPSGAIPAIGLLTGPGEASRAGDFAVPANAPPGQYRYIWTGSYRQTTPLVLSSEFQIVP